jgi:hypothetical protein
MASNSNLNAAAIAFENRDRPLLPPGFDFGKVRPSFNFAELSW